MTKEQIELIKRCPVIEGLKKRFFARVSNQFKRPLGDGYGETRDEALKEAQARADRELRTANPNWKWRKAHVTIKQVDY